MTRIGFAAVLVFGIALSIPMARGASKKEYQNQFRLMLDFAVRTNEYVRQRLGDKALISYAHAMSERNTTEAERMTPPVQYTILHPHFLLVLENIERSFFFASKGDLSHYRHHQKVVRRELQLLEALAEKERLELYMWGRGR
ncbi:MAG: hypothetical protein GY847_04300 [Proteobacteria bacterium]|nr:hypothetical protein [Pseudomonadota bacterium]